MQRRELLSSLASSLRDDSDVHKRGSAVRPPYGVDEALFHTECKNCDGKCAVVCEEKIIKIDTQKRPYLDFSYGGCTYCDACALSCEYGVLSIEHKSDIKAGISIKIENCLGWNATMCFLCKDPCLDNAILFEGLFKPTIDAEKCTSCGFCISKCPTEAIIVEMI